MLKWTTLSMHSNKVNNTIYKLPFIFVQSINKWFYVKSHVSIIRNN